MVLHSSMTESGLGSRGGGLDRQPMITLAPQDANRSDASRPMPLLPPVIRIHFPVKSKSGTSSFLELQQRRAWILHQMEEGCLHGEPLFLLPKKMSLMLMAIILGLIDLTDH